MIRGVLRGVIRFLSSTALAAGLLVFLSIWSAVATFVAQGEPTSSTVVQWASSHPFAEPLVRALGLHQAFTSGLFLACIVLLGVSTTVCSWRRTGVAIRRSRTLRGAAASDAIAVAASHDLEIVCGTALSPPEALAIASGTLGRLGVKSSLRGDVLVAVSPWWSVWGSPVFHWALVALIAVVALGGLVRSDGLMPVAVGQTKADAPDSYTRVTTGAWHDWSRVKRSIRVDGFEPAYNTGGVERGAVPTVSVLDGSGRVLAKQRVYPNMMLHSGSLSINAPECGLSVWMAFIGPSGAEAGRFVDTVDFSQTAPGGTVPASVVEFIGPSGDRLAVRATVPLDRFGGQFAEWIPKQPSARVALRSADGTRSVERVLLVGEDLELPGGGALRLIGIGWYSRLSLVDDPTIPFVYAAMVIAMLGLALTVLTRQQMLIAAVAERPEGAVLAVRMRLWRNVPTNRAEIEDELTRALCGDEKGGTL